MAESTNSRLQPRAMRAVARALPADGAVNVGDGERWLSLLGGGLLALYTLRRSLGTVVLLGGAGALLYRGLKGQCALYQAMDVSTAAHDPQSASSRSVTAPEEPPRIVLAALLPTPWQRGTKARRYDPPCLPHDDVIDHDEKEKTMQTLCLLGGMGLGAGLMYLLDPHQGERRRDRVRGYVEDYGRQTGAFVDNTGRGLRRQAQAVFATTRRPFHRQPGLANGSSHKPSSWGRPPAWSSWAVSGWGWASAISGPARGAPSSVPGGARKPAPTGVPRSAAMPTSGSSPGAGTFSKAVTRTAWMRIPASRPKPRPGMRSHGSTRVLCSIVSPLSLGKRPKRGRKPKESRRKGAGASITRNLIHEASGHRLPIPGDLSWTSPRFAHGVTVLVRSSCAAVCGGISATH